MPNGFEVSITIPELPETLKRFQAVPALRVSMINEALRECGSILTPAIKAETPIGKSPRGKATHGGGRSLAASTTARIRIEGNDQQLTITQNAKTADGVSYGVFVREGTKPHTIEARNKKALRFFMGGQEIFVKKVHHPGTKPNPYPSRAYDKVKGQIEKIVAGINQKTAENIAAVGRK